MSTTIRLSRYHLNEDMWLLGKALLLQNEDESLAFVPLLQRGAGIFNVALALDGWRHNRHVVLAAGWGWSPTQPLRPWPTLRREPGGGRSLSFCGAFLQWYRSTP